MIITTMHPATMFFSQSLLILSLVPSWASAGILRNLDRRADVCGTTGFANAAHSYFSSSDAALTTYAGCAIRCADDSKCKSFGYNKTTCLLYNNTLSASLAQYEQNDIVYFDAGCVGGLGAASSDIPPFPTSYLTATRSSSRPRATVTRTRTRSRVGPFPTGSEIPWSSFPWSSKPTILPFNTFIDGEQPSWKHVREAVQTTHPTPASTMVTIVTPLSSPDPTSKDVTPVPVAQIGHTTLGLGSNLPFPTNTGTTGPWPSATGAVPLPQGGQRNGSSTACPDGFQAWSSTTAAASKDKRWFWPFAGFGSPRPSGIPSGMGPGSFGGCVPKGGFPFAH